MGGKRKKKENAAGMYIYIYISPESGDENSGPSNRRREKVNRRIDDGRRRVRSRLPAPLESSLSSSVSYYSYSSTSSYHPLGPKSREDGNERSGVESRCDGGEGDAR